LHSRDSTVLPTINAFLRSCRENEGKALKIGAAGFCFGGRLAVLLTHNDERTSTADGKALVDVVFAGHPSQVKIPGDFEKVKLPLSLAIGSEDSWIPLKQVEELRKTLDKKAEVEHEVAVYEGAKHGTYPASLPTLPFCFCMYIYKC
jgi:dienelactone hydrolase